eukprot:14473142-Heterocapsa_arctica.AAC.1
MRLPKRALLLGANGDLWGMLHEQLSRHGGRVVAVKVAAHRTLADVRCGAVLLKEYLGNLVADRMAHQFTEPAQVSSAVEKAQAFRHAVIAKVLNHITTAMICVVQLGVRASSGRRRRDPDDPCDGDGVRVRQGKAGRRSRVPKLVSSGWGVHTLSNGHSIQASGSGTWGCMHCQLHRRSCKPKVWKLECTQWVRPAPPPEPDPVAVEVLDPHPRAMPSGLDDPEHDLDDAIGMEQ